MNIKTILLLANIATLTGCASIVSGENQLVSVNTGNVRGAVCQLSNNKGKWFVTTPGSAVVQRSYDDLCVDCKHDSGLTVSSTVSSSINESVFGNIIMPGGAIGAAIDCSNGSAYDYPTDISVQMM